MDNRTRLDSPQCLINSLNVKGEDAFQVNQTAIRTSQNLTNGVDVLANVLSSYTHSDLETTEKLFIMLQDLKEIIIGINAVTKSTENEVKQYKLRLYNQFNDAKHVHFGKVK